MAGTFLADDASSAGQLDALLRLSTVRSLVGDVAASTIWRWIQTSHFPQPVRLSDNVVGWRASEIRAWIESRQTQPAKPTQRRGGRRRPKTAVSYE
jgi:prophage regulatory protein